MAITTPLLCLAVGSWLTSEVAAAPVDEGSVTLVVPAGGTGSPVPITAGGSATPFEVRMPFGATCSGDSTTGGYRVQTFVVPVSDDLNSLTFDSSGPMPAGYGAAFRQPLFTDVGGTPLTNINTAAAGPLYPGQVPNSFPATSFAVFDTSYAPAPGTYRLGVACTNGSTLDKYWSTQITFVADAGDVPAGVTFTVDAAAPADSTTTTTTTTTTIDPTTTTTIDPTTTSSTTTTTSSTTTTTTDPTGSTTTTDPAAVVAASGSGTSSGGSTSGSLPRTGIAIVPLVLSAMAVLLLGRLLVLAGHRVRVLPPRSK